MVKIYKFYMIYKTYNKMNKAYGGLYDSLFHSKSV